MKTRLLGGLVLALFTQACTAGSTGPKGDTGETGPRGETGVVGPSGPAGVVDAGSLLQMQRFTGVQGSCVNGA
jgi:hypothetical protein